MIGKIFLTACSDARTDSDGSEIEQLKSILVKMDYTVFESRYIYDQYATGEEKACELNSLFAGEMPDESNDITAIFDVSGGNAANELLPYLDYDAIASSSAVFFGYSDLTTIINAIYTKTGKTSVLYQARHLVGNEDRQRELAEFLEKHNYNNFNNIAYRFLQGKELHGILVGGNLRCFLKLAGTEYMPDVTDKVLLMEALGGDLYSVRTMLAQLSQLGVFHKIRGIVVGTFTSLIREGEYDRFLKLLLDYIPNNMPVVVTGDIGHGADAKGIIIGKEINF